MQHQNLILTGLGGWFWKLNRLWHFLLIPAVIGDDRAISGKRHPAASGSCEIKAFAPINLLIGAVFRLRVMIARNCHNDCVLQPLDHCVNVAQFLHAQFLAVKKVAAAEDEVHLILVGKVNQAGKCIQ